MFAIPIVAAILALAGAPTNTPVYCNLPPSSAHAGITSRDATSPVGWKINVVVDPVCVGVSYLGADRASRARMVDAYKRRWFMPALAGTGALVLLHEAEHVALPDASECEVEKTAYAKLPGLLRQFEPLVWRQSMAAATYFDHSLPANYHGC